MVKINWQMVLSLLTVVVIITLVRQFFTKTEILYSGDGQSAEIKTSLAFPGMKKAA